MKLDKKDYAFQCPKHGLEVNALCKEAFKEENEELWLQYFYKYDTPEEISTDSLYDWLDEMRG